MNSHLALTRNTLLAALIGACTLIATLPTTALAYDADSTRELNVDKRNIAVHGHDVVAYFTVGAPTAGKAEFKASHGGADYHFASAANRDAFNADPARYAPQFGGFCAMGVALNKKLDGDPTAWKVQGGKLYLNVNKEVQKKWLEDVPGHLAKANAIWPEIRNKAPKAL